MNKILVLSLMLISGVGNSHAADAVLQADTAEQAYSDAVYRLRDLQSELDGLSAMAADGRPVSMPNVKTVPPPSSALDARLGIAERDTFIITQSLGELKTSGCTANAAQRTAAGKLTAVTADAVAAARRLEDTVKSREESPQAEAVASRITGYLLMAAQTVDSVTKTCRPKSKTKSPKPARKHKAAAE